jgi:DNA-binding GntR family transcriptional regulator
MTPPQGSPSIREKRADAAYDQIREFIVDGRMAPGSRLIETDLVDRLEVSRTTIRTALQNLQAEGLVLRLEGGRARWVVSPLTKPDILELSEIMSALEGLAGRRAATLDTKNRKKLANDLRQINEELRGLSSQNPPDSGRVAALDGDFHTKLVEVSAGPRLTTYCNAIKGQVARYVKTYMAFLAHSAFASADEHAAIIAAIERGNPDAAEIAIQSNWVQSAGRYVEVIDSVGEQGTW